MTSTKRTSVSKQPKQVDVPTPKVEESKPCEVPYIQAKNFTKLRHGTPVDTIVLHNTAGSMKSAINWLTVGSSHSSAHFVVGRDGSVTQLVKVSDSAWHAGSSKWNDASIGIEIEADYDHLGLTAEQNDALVTLVKSLIIQVPTIKYIYGHRDVSPKPTECPVCVFKTRKFMEEWLIVNNFGLKYPIKPHM